MRTGGFSCVLALLWGFLQAPFGHIHSEELEHRTAGPMHLHAHDAFTADGPAIGPHTADDDEIDVPWNAATSANVVLHLDATVGERVLLSDRASVSAAVLVPQHRGHDPPESSPKIPRAPPA